MHDLLSGKDKRFSSSLMRLGLSCLTPIYRIVIAWRNRKFDRAITQDDQSMVKRAGVPVISVGNLTTGGSGKTPHVIALAKRLRQQGKRVVLISRGYGSDPAQSKPNDEAMEMEHRLSDVPHLQDPNRFEMARRAIAEHDADLILLDDGFQHRQLHRDLDIVIVDATLPFGYGRLLPRGLLREPISSIARADWVIISRSDLVGADALQSIYTTIEAYVPKERILESSMVARSAIEYSGGEIPVDQLSGEKAMVVCGIGNPDNFLTSVKRMGIEVAQSRVFPDHHAFDQNDLEAIGAIARQAGVDRIVCTHKDLVKIGVDQIEGISVCAIVIEVQFQNDPATFFAAICGW